MDSTLKLILPEFQKALATLEEALRADHADIFIRDATIQRFEYSFELCWKAAKIYLSEQYGETALSPKECFRLLGKHDSIQPEGVEQLLTMVDDRNKTAHTYDEKFIASLYKKMNDYYRLLQQVAEVVTKNT